MLESKVEKRLKTKLEATGFKVLKLVTPGNAGSMDRMILAPKWSPSHPVLVEVKKPGKAPRPLQEAVRNDWIKRGVNVQLPVSTYAEVDALVVWLNNEANRRCAG